MERDGFLDNLDLTLEQAGLKPESEVSFFNIDAYNKFVVDPQIKCWTPRTFYILLFTWNTKLVHLTSIKN
ncbi:hypothetical protein AYI69_g10963 [Smittium culicis]|uniref:Uncharacterized protein n=1 Tax=Smittium culicis TaxID=133412 RepID=A0A1R1X295_9FUNG|nr:hypothetical protein AYI69_g10963 [Smittium culicis]